MSYLTCLENHLWYVDFSKGFLILGQPCQDMLQLGMLPKFSLSSNQNCDLKTLSHRLAILLCLTTGQRDQTIKCLNLDYIKISSDKVVLFVSETLKTTRPGHHLPPIELKTFKDSELYVKAHLKQYIKMTAPFRNTDTKQLLLSFAQPHKPISTTTLSRWCVTVMKQSGINVNIFGSRLTTSVSTSKCKIRGYHPKKS